MAMGSLTLACALLLANAEAPDVCYMSQGKFAIPIRFAPERRSSIKELLLYVSHDKGATWTLEARATPDQGKFPYYASGDGTYWFTVAIMDQQNHQEPVDIYQAPVGQRVVVDTRKPDIRLASDRRGDDVHVRWDIQEDNPDLNSFRLEYRMADQGAAMWAPVSVQPTLQGETTFRPTSQGTVQVRVLLNDLATNAGQGNAEVSGTAVAADNPAPPPGVALGSLGAVPSLPSTIDPPPPPPPGGALPGASVGGYRPAVPTEQARAMPMHTPEEVPLARPPLSQSIQQTSPTLLAQSDGNRSPIQPISAVSERTPSGAMYPASGGRGGLPPVELVKNRQAKIDFRVGKYGPSGIGSVDVYVTTDDGATWALSSDDNKVTLPTPLDARSGAPLQASVAVNLDVKQEGVVHGYYIVVKSRAGLGKKPPEPGTPPQVRIEMDITPPVVGLYEPVADPNRKDTLLLSWKATDKNLANNPVTIEWAEQKDGQWYPIGPAELANSGQYSWAVPANVPPSVYLRLAVRDSAGNIAVAQTDKPVLVDLSVPEPVEFKVSR